jgi:hypothetical protein
MVTYSHLNSVSKVELPELDYVRMNRNCLKKKIIDLKGMKLYRIAHPVRVNVKGGDNSQIKGVVSLQDARRKGPLPSDANKNFTYGIPTRY